MKRLQRALGLLRQVPQDLGEVYELVYTFIHRAAGYPCTPGGSKAQGRTLDRRSEQSAYAQQRPHPTCDVSAGSVQSPDKYNSRKAVIGGLHLIRTCMKEIVMRRIQCIRRLIRILAGLAGALVALGLAAPAAFAKVVPNPGPAGRFEPYTVTPPQDPAHVNAAVTVGMPGWQITLIAVGAAILGALVAVLVDRARSSRRLQATTAA